MSYRSVKKDLQDFRISVDDTQSLERSSGRSIKDVNSCRVTGRNTAETAATICSQRWASLELQI